MGVGRKQDFTRQHMENGNSHMNNDFGNQGSDLSTYIAKEENAFLLIGVMTAKKYLDTRAVAAFQTWAQTCVGTCKVIFFSSEDSTTSHTIPLVSLYGVDDVYPPQKKSFLMLQYMHDNYIDNFEWFMRADDDAFIKTDRLAKFLRSIDSSKPQYIGQAGIGRKDEVVKLHLGEHDNYCMGGPGVLFSHETLRQMAPHINSCLHNVMTTHEDVELGRCVRKYVGIPCTREVKKDQLFYHNYKEPNGSFDTTLKDTAVDVALTLHPVKDPKQQYRIANYLHFLHIEDLRQKEINLQREITYVDQKLRNGESMINKQRTIPSFVHFSPKFADEILSWEFLSKRLISHRESNPERVLKSQIRSKLEDIIIQTMPITHQTACRKSPINDCLFYGYHRLSPSYGADYILNLLPFRRHIYIQQRFSSLELIEDPFTAHKRSYESELESPFLYKNLCAGSLSSRDKITETIHFLLPLSGRLHIFMRFLDNYEKACLFTKESCRLHIVLSNQETENSDISDHIKLIRKYQNKYGGSYVDLTLADGPFARAKALDIGAAQCENDSLLFIIDVDIQLSHAMLLRIRLNTKRGVQVYYPILFSQFDPALIWNDTHLQREENSRDFPSDEGYWRSFGYGMVGVYKSDLAAVGGFNTSIRGWGTEDNDLYCKFCDSNLTVFRTIDPDLVHIFHPFMCDTELTKTQFEMCLGSQAQTFGSVNKLANIVYKQPDIFDRKLPEKGRESVILETTSLPPTP
ncbi:chondroitin sulfate synthase 1-like [Argopecten irradians]|uniref:chondroitin sulfate synthase 1-like n=1 Tax=Argopecten irradians TaxID=31199 RepID=UPI00371D6143